MDDDGLFDKRVLLISGKGGVGRTTLTGALALTLAGRGKRVLVAEIGDPNVEYSPLARLFGRDRFGNEPEDVAPGVKGCVLHARRGHERFLQYILPIPALARAALNSSALRKFFDAAPALNELGVFYHLLTLLRAKHADGSPEHEVVLFDMPATGHSLALSGVPDRVLSLMPVGPIAEAMREGQAVIEDPEQTAAWIVTLPEVLPVTETLELIEGLHEDRIPIGGVLVNKVLTDRFTGEERDLLDQMLQGHQVFGLARYDGVAQCQESIDRLRAKAGVRLRLVPELPDVGGELLQAVARELQGDPS